MNQWVLSVLCLAAGLFVVKLVYVVSVAMTVRTTKGALYVSTSYRRIQAVLDEVSLENGQVLIDLGCGDGRALRAARRRFPIFAVGYEINLMAYLKARIYSAGRGIKIKYRDFWSEPLDAADVICCYLFPDVMAELASKLNAEAKAGAVIVSFNFPMPGFTPVKILRPPGSRHNDPIYFYQMPG